MVVYRGSTEYAQIGKFSIVGGRKRRNQGNGVRRKREKRNFAESENKARILRKHEASAAIYLHTEALFVVKSSGDMVFNFVKEVNQMGKLQVKS